MARLVFWGFALIGLAYAVHGIYGLKIGIPISVSELGKMSGKVLADSERPEDQYGQLLYDEIQSVPSNAENSMRAMAWMQILIGFGFFLFCTLVNFLKPSKKRKIDIGSR